jgi:hypothetical protein
MIGCLTKFIFLNGENYQYPMADNVNGGTAACYMSTVILRLRQMFDLTDMLNVIDKLYGTVK